MSSYYFIW